MFRGDKVHFTNFIKKYDDLDLESNKIGEESTIYISK
jgi:hypothetical protein